MKGWLHRPDTLAPIPDGYKWVALFISTLGMLMATIDGSIVLISLPDIFRGIGIDPLEPGNSFYLLWMILGFLVTTSVLVVTLGRLGDIYGRVRMYNLGFAVFTFFSLALSVTWMTGPAAADYLIIMRIFQGVGAAMLMANSAAILTDAFPEDQRGMALGVNQAAAFSGSFIGLILGGLLAPINWRLIFLVSVPIGLFATVWGYLQLRELGQRRSAHIDWPGNATFALGLVCIMVGITYGIEPYGGHAMGWTNPKVIGALVAGVLLLVAFCIIELRVREPMFTLALFKIRAFTAGIIASFLAAMSRGGLMFMLIIWLQGIWLPLHGYSFAVDAAVGGHRPDPPHGRPVHRRSHLGRPVGPLRTTPLRHRRHDRRGHLPGAPRVAADRLQLRGVRRAPVLHRPDHGVVRLPQPRRCDEQPAARAPRCGLGHEHHVPELGPGHLDRRLLHADHRRAVRHAAAQRVGGAAGPRRAARRGRAGVAPAADLDAVRRLPRLRPGRST